MLSLPYYLKIRNNYNHHASIPELGTRKFLTFNVSVFNPKYYQICHREFNHVLFLYKWFHQNELHSPTISRPSLFIESSNSLYARRQICSDYSIL